jgi:hypothetical protein
VHVVDLEKTTNEGKLQRLDPPYGRPLVHLAKRRGLHFGTMGRQSTIVSIGEKDAPIPNCAFTSSYKSKLRRRYDT